RQYLEHVALAEALLHATPECRSENLPVHAQQRRTLLVAEAEEIDEGLREHIALADIEPGFAAHLVFRVGCRRQVAEVAVGDAAQLVVVVEDYAAMTRDPEVLQQQVAGEDVG